MKKRFIIIGLVIFASFIKADFASAAARFWVGGAATANWSEATGGITNWGTVSNTRDNAAVPTSADDVTFDNSANGNSPSTLDAGSIKSLTMTNYTNTLTHNAVTLTVAGNVTLGSGMTYTLVNPTTSAITVSASSSITSAGKTIGNLSTSGSVNITLLDSMISTGSITIGAILTTNTFSMNNFNCTATVLTRGSIGTKTFTLGSGTLTLTGTGTVFASPTTVTATTGTIVINDTSTTQKVFSGGNKTYNNLTVTGDNVRLQLNNTWAAINNNTYNLPTGLVFTSASTQTATSFTSTGGAKLSASIAGSPATLSIVSGTISVKGMTITDSTATGGATFKDVDGTNVSGNTGWNFVSRSQFSDVKVKGGVKIRGVAKFR